MRWKRALVPGFAAWLIGYVILGNLLFMNPLTADLYAKYAAQLCSKPVESFGGLAPWLGVMMLGGLAAWLILSAIYSILYKSIPGKGWRKGLSYGLMLFLISDVTVAFNSWLLHSYPEVILFVELGNAFVGTVVGGIVLALVYEKLK